MIILGLTGSIGMGKSTAAQRFISNGIPVLDADRVVHELYEGAAVPEIGRAFPDAVVNDRVDRSVLARHLIQNPSDFRKLEKIIHPMVRHQEALFIAKYKQEQSPLVVLEIPLLLEGDMDSEVDAVIVVHADHEVRRKRVMQRPGMTDEKLDAIIAKQMPDDMKCHKADYIVDTSGEIADTWDQIDKIIEATQGMKPEALRVWQKQYPDIIG